MERAVASDVKATIDFLFQVDLHNGGPSKTQNISGIFIKNVLPNSPAGRTGGLKVTRFPRNDLLFLPSTAEIVFLHPPYSTE